MIELEKRINAIENRQAVQDVITDYLVAVDELTDVEAVLKCFTDDAVFDMTGINYPAFSGRQALEKFFSQVFNDMSHHAHYATNFKLDSISEQEAHCRTHVIGMGVTKDEQEVLFYLQYHLQMRKISNTWKISNFRGQSLMPLP